VTSSARRGALLVATLVALPVALLAGAGVFWLLGGFDRRNTGPVQVTAPPNIPGADATCAKLLGALPLELAGQQTREVTDAPHRVVAWGDPPIVLRCGVNKPKAETPTAQVLGIDGVEWVHDVEGDTVVWTTVSLPLRVEVRASRDYTADTILTPLAAPLKAQVR
jgi:hypothetical protein